MVVVNPQYSRVPHPAGRFRSWSEFYPFYLGDCQLRTAADMPRELEVTMRAPGQWVRCHGGPAGPPPALL
jgi:hypothetical protein